MHAYRLRQTDREGEREVGRERKKERERKWTHPPIPCPLSMIARERGCATGFMA